MGATASRSSPTDKTTLLVTVPKYSKLVRVPLLHRRTLTSFSFDNLYWNVTVEPSQFNEGLADWIYVSVLLDPQFRYIPDLVVEGIGISIEVLDETGENTVFHDEMNVMLLEANSCFSILVLHRRELEASSCVHNDRFTVRCTLSKQPSTRWWCLFSEPKKVLEPEVAMAGSHMLTIGSFSKLKAALRGWESTYSTYFAVAGCRWFFQFCPAGQIGLVRASNDKTPTTAEFSFELEGVVNFKSEKMTHTFDSANRSTRYLYRFKLEPSTSGVHDRLIVRCRLAVIMEEKPSLPPAAVPTSDTATRTESILTPLLSAMYD